ncbi:2,5-dioxovalerate dehydrogenase [Cellvibrio zantedeschiae]|uniref:2,5-dioxovalerate dehydrogenase n=1 Tax=Cellvibrio zantedeschiae TaxID=1237077 RepID=A0ABQ3B2F9_9GAMM|nr:aldehyde dehydrogenase (NADP(+)) [Cellvibrio zantedeschiae]GGY76607.1 2,5-dioxovalerate dehydrogenase [Cellvibrio zantedeschiae]
MSIFGKLYFDGEWHQGQAGTYNAVDPSTAKNLEPAMGKASKAQVEAAVAAAHRDSLSFAKIPAAKRANFLRECATQIEALGDELTTRITLETGYPKGRGEGERARTCGQLRMFANSLDAGEFVDARIDTAQPDRTPVPKPDLRFMQQAIGPVAVFAVSNFPLAYSVAGGDTASALAAGCPVLAKGHLSHPGTGELVAQAIAKAIEICQMPKGVFSFLMGDDAEVGATLVQAAPVKAVGFTGSIAGGTALIKLANARPEPIPVFAEMGSVNPVILLPEALKTNAPAIAKGFVASLTLGTGQFCVNPGLVIAIDSPELNEFIQAVRAELGNVAAGVMLNQRICTSYQQGLTRFTHASGVASLAQGQADSVNEGFRAQAYLLGTSGKNFIAQDAIHEEVFGPAAMLVTCKDFTELQQVLEVLAGQLTGTLHGTETELLAHSALVDVLARKVGRVVVNGFPTGVEVCPSMVHGGPFPASSDPRFTAVGTAAIQRFQRPVCYQNFPDTLLPDALKNNNPLGLTRLVNGTPSNAALE